MINYIKLENTQNTMKSYVWNSFRPKKCLQNGPDSKGGNGFSLTFLSDYSGTAVCWFIEA